MRKVITQEEFDKMVEDGDDVRNLISLDLNDVDLTKVEFANSRFYDCDMGNPVINNRYFSDCIFIKCDFRKAVFTDCVFDAISFIRCNLTYSKFERCKIEYSKFLDVDLDWSVISHVLFKASSFIATDLNGVEFNDCDMRGAFFDSCIKAEEVKGIEIFQFSLGKYAGYYSSGHLTIGCKNFPVGYWLEYYEEIGEGEDLEEEEIELYGTIIKYIAKTYLNIEDKSDADESDTDLIAPILSAQSLLEEGKPLHGIANIWEGIPLEEIKPFNLREHLKETLDRCWGRGSESIAHPTEATSESKAGEALTVENLLKAIERLEKWEEGQKKTTPDEQ